MCTIMKCKECNILICPNYDRLCSNCKKFKTENKINNIMTTDQIKKEIYKQKPIAEVDFKRGDYIHFSTVIIFEGVEEIINFEVPISEDPNVNEVPAQLLIKWLVK